MMTQNSTPTFVILGGGIAGLTTAIALKKIGIEAVVIEAAPEFHPVGAGIVLAENALKVYKYLGIYNELCNVGNLVNQLIIYDQKGKILNKVQTEETSQNRDNLAIHRASLHKVLLGQLDHSVIFKGKKTKEVQTLSEGYKVIFEDGSFINAKYLIVAEGIHSAIRQQIYPQSNKRYSGYTCWRGIADIPDLVINEASETWGKNGRFGIVPLGNGKIYWFAVKNAKPNDPEMKNWGTKQLSEIFKNYHNPINKVIQVTAEEQILWNDIYDLEPIKRYAFENIVLIGDAAHATTPNMGQGACQAIEDAIVLAKSLSENSVVKDAFLQFETKRLKRTHYIVNQSWKMGKIAQLEASILIEARNFLLRCLPASYYRKQLQKIYSYEV